MKNEICILFSRGFLNLWINQSYVMGADQVICGITLYVLQINFLQSDWLRGGIYETVYTVSKLTFKGSYFLLSGYILPYNPSATCITNIVFLVILVTVSLKKMPKISIKYLTSITILSMNFTKFTTAFQPPASSDMRITHTFARLNVIKYRHQNQSAIL